MVVSSGDTVVVERVDVNDLGGTIVTFNVVAIFDLRDGLITCWRSTGTPGTSAANSVSTPGRCSSR